MLKYGYTKDYLTQDEKPWFPVMGEFHYSRYPEQYWEESLYKMKAGGVEVVATYAFWLHHEEIEGEYDFSGQRDLRRFVETVKKCGLSMILRIGPWCHGEARNGGFPDWIMKKEYDPRTNDERYFAEVKKYYAKLAEQVEGLLWKDGGPIIGIQIENEYGHCGGLQGEAGENHMKRLKEIAMDVGLVVPIYTATGWGGAVTGGMLPVMGGYCEAPWEQTTEELEPNENYVFTNDRNDPNIGSDHGKENNITFDMTQFPYLTAELGGGLQVTHHRRPVAAAKDIGAMTLVKLGSGVNLIGYYMYHGGTNPKGKCSTLQESKATGYLNDLPAFCYDFSAPIRAYGQMSDTLREIKLLAMFLYDFGSELCCMETRLENPNQKPEDFDTLRLAVRTNGQQGYLFVNNYQRRWTMKEHKQEVLRVQTELGEICYPAIDIYNGDYFFLPFNMPIGDGVLKSALATPLCKMTKDGEEIYVFYTDTEPQYCWEKKPTNAKVLTISRKMALNAWKLKGESPCLVFTEGNVIENESGYELLTRNVAEIKSYPELFNVPEGYTFERMENEFYVYSTVNKMPKVGVTWQEIEKQEDKKIYEIMFEYPEKKNDCFLQIDFSGDMARLYVENEWVDDWFYTGKTWEIGMKRYGFPKKVTVEIFGLKEDAEIFLETKPEFQNGVACGIEQVNVEIETVYDMK